jgi:hypothetical protein
MFGTAKIRRKLSASSKFPKFLSASAAPVGLALTQPALLYFNYPSFQQKFNPCLAAETNSVVYAKLILLVEYSGII